MKPSELKGRKLGRVLTKMGKVTREQVHEALSIQKTRKVPVGQLLIELGYCGDRDVAAALAGQAGMEYVDLTDFELLMSYSFRYLYEYKKHIIMVRVSVFNYVQ